MAHHTLREGLVSTRDDELAIEAVHGAEAVVTGGHHFTDGDETVVPTVEQHVGERELKEGIMRRARDFTTLLALEGDRGGEADVDPQEVAPSALVLLAPETCEEIGRAHV